MLDLKIIKAISLDLDDTLWPVWPAIERAEKALENWLGLHAPKSAVVFADPAARHEVRERVMRSRPELRYNLSAVRQEAIRQILVRCGEDPALAEPAFAVFFDERNRVDLFGDALQTLAFMSARFPVVALSYGNADIQRIGLAPYFQASISAQEFGVGKPDPRIFHAAAAAAGVQAHEVLHVGDDAEMDVLGGLNAGMQTVWVNRTGHAWSHDMAPHLTVESLTELCDLFPSNTTPAPL